MRSLQRYRVSRGSIGRRVAKGGGGTRNSSPSPAKRERAGVRGESGRRGKPSPHPALRASLSRCRSEEHTSELQSLMRISYAVFCLKKKKHRITNTHTNTTQVS